MSSSPTREQIAVSHDGQIQYLPVRSEQQVVNPEDLKAGDPSAVTGLLSCGKKNTFIHLFYSLLCFWMVIVHKRLCNVASVLQMQH